MLYVALGRNVGDVPMSFDDFYRFESAVVGVVADCQNVGEPDTVARGVSRFGDMREETCVLVWFDLNVLGAHTERALGDVARKFGQESIAYSLSKTFFTDGIDNTV